jgi:hypothetical protein
MTAASCQFGSMNDTTLPLGRRSSNAVARRVASVCSVVQSIRMSPSTKTYRAGEISAAVRSASARVVSTHSPRR